MIVLRVIYWIETLTRGNLRFHSKPQKTTIKFLILRVFLRAYKLLIIPPPSVDILRGDHVCNCPCTLSLKRRIFFFFSFCVQYLGLRSKPLLFNSWIAALSKIKTFHAFFYSEQYTYIVLVFF